MPKVLTIFLTIFWISPLLAQSAQLELQRENSEEKEQSNWSGSLSTTTISGIRRWSSYNSTLNTSVGLTLRYRAPYFNTKLYISGDKNFTGERKENFSTGYLELSRQVKALSTKKLTTLLRWRIYAPLNSDLRFQTSYRGGLAGEFLFLLQMPNPKHQMILISRVTKNFHEYKISRSNNKNTSFSNINSLIWSYTPYKRWEASLYGSITNSWNYDRDLKDNVYSIGQSLTYQSPQHLDFTLGHEIGGYTYGYYGNNMDLSLVDTDNSLIYGTITYNF